MPTACFADDPSDWHTDTALGAVPLVLLQQTNCTPGQDVGWVTALTCIRNLLRFWYVFRLVSMLVGVHGAARGVLLGFLLDLLLLLTPAAKLTLLLILLVLLMMLLPASAALDVDVSPAAAAQGAAAAEVLTML